MDESQGFSKAEWLARNLRCLACNQPLSPGNDAWVCPCGTTYPIIDGAISSIDDELAEQTRVNAENRVSSHPYSPTAIKLLESAANRGGMVLDCGSGCRDFTHEHLIQTEITPYANVDVLAVNQRLPFADGVFDVAFSFDVLEHVTDPFQSARELARVLKPGGLLYLSLPFLQTEHGYPHHYFNATLEGVRQLFSGLLRCDGQAVPKGGHPSTVVWQMMNVFQSGLQKARRSTFHEMTIGEILAGGPHHLATVFGDDYAEPVKRRMAGVSQAIFTKAEADEGNLLGIEIGALPRFKG
jgi:SAM-dependent methyltransferase